ncbi:MAG: hypothetical protein ACWA45_02310, partial [Flavobacteriales bacterium]
KNQLLLFVLLIQFSGIYAQEYFPKNDGVKEMMGYKNINYDYEPAPWRKKWSHSFKNEKVFAKLKRAKKKALRLAKRKK